MSDQFYIILMYCYYIYRFTSRTSPSYDDIPTYLTIHQGFFPIRSFIVLRQSPKPSLPVVQH